jgi:hypothetical protein
MEILGGALWGWLAIVSLFMGVSVAGETAAGLEAVNCSTPGPPPLA